MLVVPEQEREVRDTIPCPPPPHMDYPEHFDLESEELDEELTIPFVSLLVTADAEGARNGLD